MAIPKVEVGMLLLLSQVAADMNDDDGIGVALLGW